MRTWELAEVYRMMAELLESEGSSSDQVQAYRDTARWIGGGEGDGELEERASTVVRQAADDLRTPRAPFDGLTLPNPALAGFSGRADW